MTIEFCGSYSYTLFISFSYLFSHSFLVAYYIIIIINVSNKKKIMTIWRIWQVT